VFASFFGSHEEAWKTAAAVWIYFMKQSTLLINTRENVVVYFMATIVFIVFCTSAFFVLRPFVASYVESFGFVWNLVYLIVFCCIGFYTYKTLPAYSLWTIGSLFLMGVLAAILLLSFAPKYLFF
jgi:hypothetical protein